MAPILARQAAFAKFYDGSLHGRMDCRIAVNIFGALAAFERNLIREQTLAGLEAARARGRNGGRRPKLGDKQRALAVELYRQKRQRVGEICQALGISKPTLYAYVKREESVTGRHPPGGKS